MEQISFRTYQMLQRARITRSQLRWKGEKGQGREDETASYAPLVACGCLGHHMDRSLLLLTTVSPLPFSICQNSKCQDILMEMLILSIRDQ